MEIGGNLVHEELEHEGLPDDALEHEELPDDALEVEYALPDSFENVLHDLFTSFRSGTIAPALARSPEAYKNALEHMFGRSRKNEFAARKNRLLLAANIRELADQFTASNERSLIREQAEQVDLGHINEHAFFELLNEIFRNGVDTYSVVATFFFCSDVLIQCVKRQLCGIGTRLYLWSQQFLIDRVYS